MFARTQRAMLATMSLVVLSLGAAQSESATVTTEDVFIDHVSTVPANEGETVQLFARRYHTDNPDKGAVIMISSGTLPSEAGLGLDLEGYDYLEHFATLGFDVFAADVTGYGFSPKPMMEDPCNVDPEVQEQQLVPNPLSEPCEPSYPHPLTSYFSDWDEIGTIVEYVQELTGDDQVILMGWSLSGPRSGGYAAQHPEDVERLVMISPTYPPEAPSERPDERPAGHPLRLGNVNGLTNFWGNMVQCDNWADVEGVRNQLNAQLNTFDPLAAEWGDEPGILYRAPSVVTIDSVRPGWNRDMVRQIRTPTLVIRGLDDTLVENSHVFYEHLVVDDKIRVDFECGTHWAIWERSREDVRQVLSEFLQSGTVMGQNSGVIQVDREGQFQATEAQ